MVYKILKRELKIAMRKVESSIPGLVPLPRDERMLNTPWSFLEGRRKVDGAEGLWRIENDLYDLEDFAKVHPGGAEWIRLTKGTDITEIFKTYHLTDKPSRLLPKFFARPAISPRAVPLTFEPDGFFEIFKNRALEAMKDVNFHQPSRKSNLFTDFLMLSTIFLSLSAAFTESLLNIFAAGAFLAWTTIASHNYLHMRDNFRMYYFDLSIMSSKDWRISHALSHHMYPNTFWDYEAYSLERFVSWYPDRNKSWLRSFTSHIVTPIIWSLLFLDQGIKRYYSAFFEYRTFEFRDVVPFLLPLVMSFVTPNIWTSLKIWSLVILASSFVFSMIGFNAAHHHPDIFHDGDIYRDNLDWGLLELDAVRDRKVIDDSNLLVLTNFGQHSLHHLLPTVDHIYLPLCTEAFMTTCKDFGISTEKFTQWELLKGQFRQLWRKQPKKNIR